MGSVYVDDPLDDLIRERVRALEESKDLPPGEIPEREALLTMFDDDIVEDYKRRGGSTEHVDV